MPKDLNFIQVVALLIAAFAVMTLIVKLLKWLRPLANILSGLVILAVGFAFYGLVMLGVAYVVDFIYNFLIVPIVLFVIIGIIYTIYSSKKEK